MFNQYKGLLRYINWSNISSDMILVNGVYQERINSVKHLNNNGKDVYQNNNL